MIAAQLGHTECVRILIEHVEKKTNVDTCHVYRQRVDEVSSTLVFVSSIYMEYFYTF